MILLLPGCTVGGFLIKPISTTDPLQEKVLLRDRALFVPHKIAVIDVDGIMVNSSKKGLFSAGENPVSVFIEKLDKAQKDRRVKAIVLRLNTPGGTVAASDVMHHALKEFKRKSHKPVVAAMLDVTASGGYYLACAADKIIAQPTTITGSIGTIFQTVSFAGTMEKLGIKSQTIKSGKLKSIGSPLHDMNEDERRVLQRIIDHFYNSFLDVVLDGRPNLTRNRLKELADGRVFTADQALKNGLIDEIGYLTDAVNHAKKLAGINRAKVVIYQRPFDYMPNLYATSSTTLPPASLVNIELPHSLTSHQPSFLSLSTGAS
ncbi:MAG: signal peptide peptidase SppA, partial [Planctomycetes bacterium]|nr:signal peptide peptidase SppA [Planctomycetota bacterium]